MGFFLFLSVLARVCVFKTGGWARHPYRKWIHLLYSKTQQQQQLGDSKFSPLRISNWEYEYPTTTSEDERSGWWYTSDA